MLLLIQTAQYVHVLRGCNFKNGNDFLVADDFDAVMAVIDVAMLENDAEMLSEVNSVLKNLPSAKKSGQHHGHICSKICLSELGLPRQVK